MSLEKILKLTMDPEDDNPGERMTREDWKLLFFTIGISLIIAISAIALILTLYTYC